MTKREFLDTVFALAPNEANAIMDAFDEYVESNVVPTGRSGKERRMIKYIIEIPDDVQYVLFNGKADNKYYTAVRPIAELEELNSDYINENFGSLQDEAYQAGLNDAWKAAQRICAGEFCGKIDTGSILNMTAQQAIDKIKAYEDKHSDRIEVGDEIRHDIQGIGVATRINEVNGTTYYNAVWSNGNTGYYRFDDLKKTGNHYDIQSILEAMRTA